MAFLTLGNHRSLLLFPNSFSLIGIIVSRYSTCSGSKEVRVGSSGRLQNAVRLITLFGWATCIGRHKMLL